METSWEFIVEEMDFQYYCILCDCKIFGTTNVENHFQGKRHENSVNLHGDYISFNWVNRYHCNLCECYISGYQNITKHVLGKMHQDFLNDSESESSEESHQYVAMESDDFIVRFCDSIDFECFLCDKHLPNKWRCYDHLQSREHREAVQNYGCNIFSTETGRYYCDLCDCNIPSYKHVNGHVYGKKHDDHLYETESESD